MTPNKKTRRPAAAAGTLAVLLAAPFAFVGAAQAATIVVSQQAPGIGNAYDGDDTLCSLAGAIINANTDSQSGDPGCAAGSGADTIVLPNGVTFTLDLAGDDTGNNGLPRIFSAIIIKGNGSTIQRSTMPGTPDFRLLEKPDDEGTDLTLEDLTLRGGFSPLGNTGALSAVGGRLTMRRCSVVGNSGSSGGGVAIAAGDALIEQSLIAGNTSLSADGGGLLIGELATVTLRNSTVSGNSAGSFGSGGGISIRSGAVTVLNSTITGNSSAFYGGVYVASGTLDLRNSIVSGNTATSSGNFKVHELGANAAQFIVSNNNVLGHSGKTYAESFDSFNPDASDTITTSTEGPTGLPVPTPLAGILNATLADNGGPTQTHALVAGSPAVNAGGSGATTTDQRGFVKAEGDTVRDIGAFELNGVAPTPAPVVSSISPTSGPATGGTVVTVAGSNFLAGSTSVSFGGTTVAAANVAVSSSTSLSVVSPAGSGTVNVTVTTAGGTSATGPQFTYNAKVDGTCGSASGVPSSTAPAANLCATGTATAVSGTGTAWTWGCDGSNGGTSTAVDACSASYPKPSLTINANPLSIAIDGISTVTASSDNGLAPVLSNNTNVVCALGSSSDSANVSASATGTAAGTCTIAANQPAITTGTTRYQSADPKTVSITVNKKAQTITGLAASPGTIFVGGSSSVSAMASSGLTVSFGTSPSSVCTNNGSMVTGVGAGTCTVTASQAGNDSFAAAPPVTTTITVNAVPVNGLCGSAKTTSPTATMPSGSTLCSAGVASPVTGSSGVWAWSCNGTNGGSSDTSCSAPYGTQSLSLSATPSSIRVGESASILASSSAGLTVSLATTSPACTLSGSTATGTNEGSCVVSASQPGTGDTGTTRYVAAASVNTTLTVNPAGSPPSACDHFTPGANVIDLRSSPGGQTVRGEASRFNVIYGSGFADTITGGNAGNCIDAGAGNDRLTAGNGENHLYGGAGNDTLTPGSGSTAMDGGPGTDKCLRASSRATATYASCESF